MSVLGGVGSVLSGIGNLRGCGAGRAILLDEVSEAVGPDVWVGVDATRCMAGGTMVVLEAVGKAKAPKRSAR